MRLPNGTSGRLNWYTVLLACLLGTSRYLSAQDVKSLGSLNDTALFRISADALYKGNIFTVRGAILFDSRLSRFTEFSPTGKVLRSTSYKPVRTVTASVSSYFTPQALGISDSTSVAKRSAKSSPSATLKRRVFELAIVRHSGEIVATIPRSISAGPPTSLMPTQTNSNANAVVRGFRERQQREPQFRTAFVVAYNDRAYVLDDSTGTLFAYHGAARGVWQLTLPDASLFQVLSAVRAAPAANRIELGFFVDGIGRIWVKRPRSGVNSAASWFVISPGGAVLGIVRTS